MAVNTGLSDGVQRSLRAAQNLRNARHWIVLVEHPLRAETLPSYRALS
jgi:hypothetical protein